MFLANRLIGRFGRAVGWLQSRALDARRFSRYLGQPSPATHPHLLKKDHVTRGISKSEYAERRARFWANCCGKSSTVNSVVLIPASSTVFAAPDVPYPFRQDSNFFYLCGFREPCSLLVLYSDGTSHKSALFVGERNERKELWEGPAAGWDGATWLTGVSWSAEHSSVAEFIRDLIKLGISNAYAITNERTMNNMAFKIALNELSAASINTQCCLTAIEELRWIKSAAEMELMRQASAIGSAALTSTMKFCRAGQEEGVLISKMDLECKRLSAERLAYPPVVGAGNRANTIHYLDANQIIVDGELILMDAGCECGGYVSDITRTWPSASTFSPSQSMLYDILHDCQVALIQGVKEHRLCDLRSIYFEMLVRLGSGLQTIGVLPTDLRPEDFIHMGDRFCPHHVGHYLGLDVHDTGTLAKDRPFKPGVVITVEPGLYFSAVRTDIPDSFRGIGMRIEDDILITDTGADVLTKCCPKSRKDIEALRRRELDLGGPSYHSTPNMARLSTGN